ncbi:hypothetical protein FOG18_12610 [Legionella israelensis]|uniref:hypothetical protein n=1 Tax=Legionella israelensis TaxID=454 RepID=UPI00117F0066|nr:hypothetical protein [Legionella israelensis]QDP73345.1 hypothetical protein FOG18_12610 [Legionella israelensis]
MKKSVLGITLLLSSSIAMASSGSYLFLETAYQGSLIKNKDNSYSLTLQNESKNIDYFADRPARKTGTMPLQEFVGLWKNKDIKNNFSDIPPNVAITLKDAAGQSKHFFAEVLNPTYSKDRVNYKLIVLSKNPVPTGKVKDLSLFFDGIHWNPGGFGR